jgi:uncharacterized repeat protein (TIGR01451 family)/LPXTG-motif cell wall-anchored protein
MNRKKQKAKPRKKLFNFIAFIAMLFQFFSIIPTLSANATDITGKFNFITEVSLTDENGKPINDSSNPISKNAEVKLTYKFAIPNEEVVKKGDTYVMQIPKEIQIIGTLNFPINLENGETIANVVINTDGAVVITFNEFSEKNSNISGYFYIDTQFNIDEIGNNNPIPIKFEVGGNSEPIIINVDFEQPEIPNASIKKEGSYDASRNEITWKVTVNPESVKVYGAQVIDDIRNGQEFVPNSVKINGATPQEANYNYDLSSKKLTYNFPNVIETTQIITFKTKVTDSKLSEDEGATIYQYNTAIFKHDGTSVNSNEASVGIKTDFVRKDGKYDALTKRINWSIYVNNNSQNIPNAVTVDDIPAGLTFVPGSVKVDGIETNSNYSIDGQKFIYTFPWAINEPHKIEFSTEVTDEAAYNSNTGKTYNNKVTLTGSGVPSNASDTKGVGVPSSIINKQGIGYNAATGEITWKITINTNKILIKNAIISDEIRVGQEYVEGSASIDKSTPGGSFNYLKAESGDKQKTGTLTYSFNSDINEPYVITFRTRVTDSNVYAGNKDQNYYNEAKLTGDNIITSKSQGTQRVQSEVINKTSQDYNYITREVTWKIVVNKNKIKLPNAKVLDTINKGQEFVVDSVMLNGSIADKLNYTYDESTRTLTYNFPSEINNEQVITFKTKITDTSIFNNNGEKEIRNTAKLITDLVPSGVESTGIGKIKNTLIDKKADYTRGNSYIDWNVIFNSNKVPITDIVLTDNLQEGLELDTTSVKLYKQVLKQDGKLERGEEISLGKDNVKYNVSTREFNFILPGKIEDAYILTFRTNVVDKKKTPFTNSISFKGTGLIESSSSGNVDVIFQGAGGGGIGETGSIKVIKVNSNNENIRLQGAVFELLDRYQNVIRTSQPTEGNGEIVFDKLKFEIDYYVREKQAPTGYILGNEVYRFQIKNSEDKKNISYNYKNRIITGEIEFFKFGENGKTIKDAEFTLYSRSDTDYQNPLMVAISNEAGKVEFKNVEYGDYIIKETKAPEGYVISNKTLNASITEDGKVIKANPESISNTKIRGNIEFTKLGEGNEVLQGATFTLYKATDIRYENPIAVIISDESGSVEFNNIEYGKYAIKETKAPEGYVLSEEILRAEIKENGTTIKANPESISNTKIRGNIEFTKLGESKEALQGAEFTLYNEVDEDYKNPISVVESDESGKVEFKNIEYGRYVIKETRASEGYILSEEKLTAEIKENGIIIKANPESISNTKIRGNIEFTKLGENKEILQGAEFTLYKSTDTNYEKPIAVSISSKDGKVEFKNIEYGRYIIKETKAPEGYVLSEEELKAEIKENEVTVKANPESISNNKIRGSVKIIKLDDNKKVLKDSEFTLYDMEGKEIDKLSSGEDGVVLFENLIYGKYIIKETKAPEGYIASKGVINVFIDKNQKVYDYEVINNKIKGVVIITKTDMKGKLLKGAEFTLYDREGNVISKEVSKEDGLVTFSNIDYGEYIIKETKAPKGYILGNKQLEIKVKSPETQNFTVKNESEKIIDKVLNVLPNTGNKFDPRAIIIVGVITALGGVYLFLRRSKIS